MDRRTFLQTVPGVAVLAGATSGLAEDTGKSGAAPELSPIVLPKPEAEGGKSVLAAWFHNCDKNNTARELKLRPEQRVLFAQTVGYPA